MKVFVTGGAGYIGSVAVESLLKAGHEVVVFDSLYMGHREAVSEEAVFIEGDLSNQELVRQSLLDHRPNGIMHFASHTMVGESMEKPFMYLRENTVNALNLIEGAVEAGVERFILSSTANLFDDPESMPIAETERIVPGSPYGESKFIVERLLHWTQVTKGLRYACLRYFNAAGCTAEKGEDHTPETHIIPLVLQVALGQREKIMIFGDDYDTPDGSCVRDYIHVADLASAHILAMEALGEREFFRYNLGNGNGFSVKQVVETAREVTGHPIPAEIVDRRPGDPDILIADSTSIRRDLGWEPQYPDLKSIIQTAWDWHNNHPSGYTS